MSEVLFYHLTGSPVEATLPTLLEKSLERGWKVVIRSSAQERIEALDRHLWTYRDDSFLPHGVHGDVNSEAQPIVLTHKDNNPNGAQVLMLLDGVWAEPAALKSYERTCAFFDGNDPDAVAEARAEWKKLKEAGLDLKYWAQDNGSWVQKS